MKEAAKNCMTSCFLILTEPYHGDQFKVDELVGGGGGSCAMYGGEGKCIYNFGEKT